MERGSTRQSSLKGWEKAIVNQMNTGTMGWTFTHQDSKLSTKCVYLINLINGTIGDVTEEVDTQGCRSQCKESANIIFNQFWSLDQQLAALKNNANKWCDWRHLQKETCQISAWCLWKPRLDCRVKLWVKFACILVSLEQREITHQHLTKVTTVFVQKPVSAVNRNENIWTL